MKRRHARGCAGLFGLLLAGCAHAQPLRPLNPSLIFDVAPSDYDAEQFVAREARTAAPGFADEGESVRYREFIYDRQGDRHHFRDYYSRGFSSLRKGRGHR